MLHLSFQLFVFYNYQVTPQILNDETWILQIERIFTYKQVFFTSLISAIGVLFMYSSQIITVLYN